MNELELTTASEAVRSEQPSQGMALRALALAGVGALALGALNASPAQAISPALRFADIPGTGDIKVLNYALALEDLETEAYVQAVQRLTRGGSGGRDAVPGTRIPGLGLSTNERDVSLLTRFTRVESQHRDFLRGAVGPSAIRPFNYNFNIATLSRAQVLNLIYMLELGGTRAYLGAIPFFATKRFVQTAAAIQGTEARHTAILADLFNDIAGAAVQPTPPQGALPGEREAFASPDQTLAMVSPYIVRPSATAGSTPIAVP